MKAVRALRRSDLPVPIALLAWVSYVSAETKAELAGAAQSPGIDAYLRIWDASRGAHPLDRLLDLNLRTYLLDDLLPKVDRMAMAHGLEVRSPFLDRELAEFAFRLPPRSRVRGMSLKRVLKAAVADLLPGELLQRPKQGFGVPWVAGFAPSSRRWSRAGCAIQSRGVVVPPAVDTSGRLGCTG